MIAIAVVTTITAFELFAIKSSIKINRKL